MPKRLGSRETCAGPVEKKLTATTVTGGEKGEDAYREYECRWFRNENACHAKPNEKVFKGRRIDLSS